jgi:hypothetical protein
MNKYFIFEMKKFSVGYIINFLEEFKINNIGTLNGKQRKNVGQGAMCTKVWCKKQEAIKNKIKSPHLLHVPLT